MDHDDAPGARGPRAGEPEGRPVAVADGVLIEAERRLREVLDRANLAVAMLDVSGRVDYCNDALLALVRRRRDEVEGRDWFETSVPESERAAQRARFRSEVESGCLHGRFEGEVLAGEGSRRLFSWSAMLRHDAQGRVCGLTILGEDVTDRRQAERELLEQKALYERILAGLVEGVWVADRRDVIRYANAAAAELFGIPLGWIVGAPVSSVPALSSPKAATARAEARGTGQPVRFERARIDGPEGERHFSGWMIPVLDPDARIIGTLSDESEGHRHEGERRRMQERLALADRLASVGTLAAGMAHEVNNPLTYISANLDYAIEALRASPAPELAEVVLAMEEARDGATRVRDIVRDLKSLARGDEERVSPVDVERSLERSINIAMNEIKHRAKLVRRLNGVPRVNGNDSRLGQVFLNLLVNAAQAIPEGRAGENEIAVATFVVPDGRIAVEITDTGSGIPPELLSRIFDPFFTTKRIGEGMGLGLAICHGIVSGMGGEIEVESTAGIGSRFRVLLPAAGGPPGVTSASAAADSLRRGRVLVVEDEPLVARAVQRMLSAEHDVDVAESARDALKRLWAGERFDAVLCDLLMPDMTGMDLHDELVHSAPAQLDRLVFMTGGAFTDRARAFLAEVNAPCLDKPVDPGELRALVRRMMG